MLDKNERVDSTSPCNLKRSVELKGQSQFCDRRIQTSNEICLDRTRVRLVEPSILGQEKTVLLMHRLVMSPEKCDYSGWFCT